MRFSILLILSFVYSFSFLQKGKIEGKVTDASTGHPLTGVSVLWNNAKGTSTDINGNYIITTDGSKTVSLVFSYNGTTQQIDGIEITEGKTTVQD